MYDIFRKFNEFYLGLIKRKLFGYREEKNNNNLC